MSNVQEKTQIINISLNESSQSETNTQIKVLLAPTHSFEPPSRVANVLISNSID